MKTTLLRWFDGDVGYSFRTSPVAMVAAFIAFVCVFCALFAGAICWAPTIRGATSCRR